MIQIMHVRLDYTWHTVCWPANKNQDKSLSTKTTKTSERKEKNSLIIFVIKPLLFFVVARKIKKNNVMQIKYFISA